MKPIIAITSDYSYESQKYMISQYYIDAVKKAGGYPILLFDDTDFPECINGILFTGGGDINPILFGEEPIIKNGEISPKRDDFELKLCQWGLSQKIPMLGICRGMQIIALCTGGNIYQDIYTQTDTNIKHIQNAPRFLGTHTIDITEESLLYKILNQKEYVVNTFHHQAVKQVGEDFLISAKSKDGIIEAIEHKTLPFVVGVQWHPETMKDTKLFQAFINAILKKGKK